MIVDGHIHFTSLAVYPKLMADMQRMGVDQFCMLSVGQISEGPNHSDLAQGIWLKHRHPDKVYLFGGLDYTGAFAGEQGRPEVPLEEQLQDLIDMGCDGLKLLTGKPTMRKSVPIALDSEVYRPFLTLLEKTRFPVLWHVGDPPEFWDENAVPLWAKQNRWWYDESYPPKSLIDREIASVFQKYPKLNLVLPHFFFLSDRLEEAAELLDSYPGFFLDTAPGVEMQHNFTRNYEASRAFFIKYASRINLGTDIGIGAHITGPDRGPMVRRWLEDSVYFPVAEDPCMTPDERGDIRGLGLPKDALRQIEGENFFRLVGARRPKPLNLSATRKVLKWVSEQARRRGDKKPEAEQVLAEIQ